MQDFEHALLGLRLIQAKQCVDGGPANVSRLRRSQQALIERLGRFGVARGSSGLSGAEGRFSYRGLKVRLRVFGKRDNSLPGRLIGDLSEGDDGGPGNGQIGVTCQRGKQFNGPRISPVTDGIDDLDAGDARGGGDGGTEDFVRFAGRVGRQSQASNAGGLVALQQVA